MPAVPLRIATAAEVSAIRSALDRLHFNEPALCDRLGVSTLDAVDMPLFKSLESRLKEAGGLEVLGRLFLFGASVQENDARAHLSAAEFDAFRSADLLRNWADPSDRRLFSPVRLVPVHVERRSPSSLLLASDRVDHPDGSRFTPFADIVFSAHNPLTRQFLTLLPIRAGGRVLDLCSGTGVAALAMASDAAACTAADVAERSTHFARFNAWLNGCEDVEVVCGDLYQPLAGRTFDRIVAHPPYVPAVSQTLTYRDGGETGDAIIRGVIRGVPDHLATSGTFHVLCLGMDTSEGVFEERARAWLGSAAEEFDIVFALDSITPPELIASRIIERSGGAPGELEGWRELFARLQVKEFVYGALVGRHFQPRASGEAFTRRVLMTPDTRVDAFEWLFGWFDWLRLPERHSRILGLAPRLSPDLRLDVQHQVNDGAFVPATYYLENGGRPFRARLSTEAWVVALASEFDGTRAVRDVFADAKARGRVPPDFGDADLERLIAYLVERGCLSVTASGIAPD